MSVRSRGDSRHSLGGSLGSFCFLCSDAWVPRTGGVCGGRGVKWEVEGAAESCASGVGKRGLQSGEGPAF